MELKTKKIIAREFLLLLICLGVFIITFISFFTYNSIKESKFNKLQNEINLNETSNNNLNHSYDKKYQKHAWLYNKINAEFDLENSKYNDPEKLWKRLNDLIQKDSLRYKYEHYPDIKKSFKLAGLTSVESVEIFIKTNNLNKAEISDIEKIVKKNKLDNLLKSKATEIKNSILSPYEKTKLSLWVTLTVFL